MARKRTSLTSDQLRVVQGYMLAVNHATSLNGGYKADWEPHRHDGDVCIRSLYFQDPNGIVREFAAWMGSWPLLVIV